MKKILEILFIFSIGVFILTSCEKEINEYTLKDLGTDPVFVTDVAATNATDTGFVLTVTSSITGVAYYAVTLAGALEEAPIYQDVVFEDVAGSVKSGSLEFTSTNPVSVTFTDLSRNASYDIFAVMTTEKGLVAEVSERVTVTTLDHLEPAIEGFMPERGTTLVDADFLLGIEFNEPVRFVDGKSITITSMFYGYSETIIADSIIYDGNSVYFKHSMFPYNDYIFINVEEGAFVDLSDNIAPEVYTVNGVQLDWYFRVTPDPANFLKNVFPMFIGDMDCTDYLNADSSTVDYGPYGVTIAEDADVEYGVVISGYWGYGAASVKMVFHENGTVTCDPQVNGLVNSNDDELYSKCLAPNIYTDPVGHWYADGSFDIAMLNYIPGAGNWDPLYQVYEQEAKSKVDSKSINKLEETYILDDKY